jgi:hypothetical protein
MVSGGLGDIVIIGRFLRDLAATVEPFTFDVLSSTPDLVRWVYADIPGFRESHLDLMRGLVGMSYDVGLYLNQLAVVQYETLNWRRIRRAKRFLATITALMSARQRGLEPYVQFHPRLDNGLARLAVYRGCSRRDFLHHMAGLKYGGDQFSIESDVSIVGRLGLGDTPFITVHNGFDINFIVTQRRPTKCYPHFDAVVAQIKRQRPDLTVVQIGTTTSEPIAGVDVDLIGKTTLKEVAGLLMKSQLHLDNESGLVHLASCLASRCLVVFGPTPSDYFSYPQNINVDPVTCGGCWWIDETWMNHCTRGLEKPACTYEQPPQGVADRALEALGSGV